MLTMVDLVRSLTSTLSWPILLMISCCTSSNLDWICPLSKRYPILGFS